MVIVFRIKNIDMTFNIVLILKFNILELNSQYKLNKHIGIVCKEIQKKNYIKNVLEVEM